MSKLGVWLSTLLEQQIVRTTLDYKWVAGAAVGSIGLAAAAWNNRDFAWFAIKVLAFAGFCFCIVARYWRLAIIAGDEPTHWLGLILPVYVAVYRDREELSGPDRLSLLGVTCLIVAVVLACIAGYVWHR